MTLTNEKLRFIDEYLVDLNATQAALRTGCDSEQAYALGCEKLRDRHIATAVSDQKQARLKRKEASEAYVVATIVATIERCLQPPQESQDKFDPASVLKGCELLGKHLGMFRDKAEAAGKNGLHTESNPYENLSDDEIGERLFKLLNGDLS